LLRRAWMSRSASNRCRRTTSSSRPGSMRGTSQVYRRSITTAAAGIPPAKPGPFEPLPASDDYAQHPSFRQSPRPCLLHVCSDVALPFDSARYQAAAKWAESWTKRHRRTLSGSGWTRYAACRAAHTGGFTRLQTRQARGSAMVVLAQACAARRRPQRATRPRTAIPIRRCGPAAWPDGPAQRPRPRPRAGPDLAYPPWKLV
jgi:hypothetical protein